jgi:hypothetical protein
MAQNTLRCPFLNALRAKEKNNSVQQSQFVFDLQVATQRLYHIFASKTWPRG